MRFSDYIIYADESGNANPNAVDDQFPMFGLVFCIFRTEDYVSQVGPSIQRFKFAHFGHEMIVLHENDIRRSNSPFESLNSPDVRHAFVTRLAETISRLPMTIIASVIDKRTWLARGDGYDDMYATAARSCLQRINRFLNDHGQQDRLTHVFLERRGRREDRALTDSLIEGGNGRMREPLTIPVRIQFAAKEGNLVGMQIADLAARPIVLSIAQPERANRAYDVLAPKIWRSSRGETMGWGLDIIRGTAKDPGQ